MATAVEVGVEVVWATLLWIEGEVEHGQGVGGSVVAALITVRKELINVDLTYIMVGQLLDIVLDMCWRKR